MVGSDIQALVQIETVSDEAMDAAVEVKLLAAEPARFAHQPIEKAAGVSLAAVCLGGDQVIDVERLAPGQHLDNTVTGGGHHVAGELDEREAVTGALHLPLQLSDKSLEIELRAQLVHNWEAAPQILSGLGNSYVGHLERMVPGA